MSNLKALSEVSLPERYSAPELFSQNWTMLAMPQRMRVDSRTLSSSFGRFTIEPLERGYAVTLGHSLRRTLLASMKGSAIVAIQVAGVKSTEDALPAVKGGLLQLMLNLKELEVLQQETGLVSFGVSVENGGRLTGADLAAQGKIKVRNPHKLLAQLEDGASLDLTIYVRSGRGYVTAEENQKLNLPDGTLYLDSHHSPIREIRYEVENARVEQKTDYDRLIFEIWTSGTITPQDSLAQAAWVLRRQLGLFIHFDENIITPPPSLPQNFEQIPLSAELYRPVSELELSVRSINCLQNAKIDFIGELVQRNESELLQMKNFGRKSLNEIRSILSQMNLSLGMELEGFDPNNPPEDLF